MDEHLSGWDLGAPEPCPEPFNLAAYVLACAGQVPDRIALQVVRPAGAERWSYARLADAVRGSGAGFLALAGEFADRCVVVDGNRAVDAVATEVARIARERTG